VGAKPILLAEDDSNDVFMFWQYHKMCGVNNHLEVFSDGEDIITYFKSGGANCPLPVLVFLDLKMPRMGGLQVLEFLRRSDYAGFSSVILTGNEDPELRARAERLGAASCLSKPMVKRQFCELMGRTEGIEMVGCADMPLGGLARATSLQGGVVHAMHREIFGGGEAWWGARIAVIGRDDATKEAFRRLLRAAGLEPDVFASSEEFLASGQVERTDCVLLNTSLPAIDCPFLAERLRGMKVALPIVVITSPSAFGQLVDMSSHGVVACLASPVEWGTLRNAISSALRRI